MNSSKGKEKEIEPKKQSLIDYNKASDIIVKNIFEKILSLSITKAEQNLIEKQIPNYCFDDIKQSLELAICIDFLNYDKDDMKVSENILNYTSKSAEHININLKYEKNNKSFYDLKKSDKSFQKKIRLKNKSEKQNKYKFHNNYNPNYSNENSINVDMFKSSKKLKEKNNKNNKSKRQEEKYLEKSIDKSFLNRLIIRDNSYDNKENDYENNEEKFKNENEEPFVVNSPEIENIQRIETHKIDYNLKFHSSLKKIYNTENKILYDVIKEGKNNWGMITQPPAPSIDRDAGTKIKFTKPTLKLKKNKDMINEEEIKKENEELNKEQNQNDKSDSINKKKNENKKKLKVFRNTNQSDIEKNKKKKKFLPVVEFPSEDLDPKIFERENENADLQKLRDDLEREIAEKKLEIANKLKKEKEEQALEKALEEKRKELANKNVTVDVKGELVYIKSLDINQFINDFTKTKSKFKEIKTIEYESKIRQPKKKKTTIVERNQESLIEVPEQEKPHKKRMKVKNNRRKSFINDDKKPPTQTLGLGFFDKNKEPLIGAGSNFDIMSPECGVNVTEEKKTKSGGKDFFHKYNKFSIQVFEETLNRTISANMYQNQINNILNNHNVMSLKKKKTIKDIILETAKGKEEDNKKTNNKDNNANNSVPKEPNNKLSLKTKNLKMALNSLDLITESDEKYLLEKKDYKNKDIIKRKQFIIDFNKQEQKDYEEINKFAKTILGNENWGVNVDRKNNLIKQNFRRPQKPVFDDLKKELPFTILNHLPRKRLPPINVINRLKENSFGKTMSEGFFNKNKKNKLKPLYNEENKNLQTENEDGKNNNNINKNVEDKKNDHNFSTTSDFYKNTIS